MKKNEKEKRRYEAPQLTAVSCQPERGFAGSLVTTLVTLLPSSQDDTGRIDEDFDNAGNLWTY